MSSLKQMAEVYDVSNKDQSISAMQILPPMEMSTGRMQFSNLEVIVETKNVG